MGEGWTAGAVAASVVLFVVAGVCEVGGGWLVWRACREVRRRTLVENTTPRARRSFFFSPRSDARSPPRRAPPRARASSLLRTQGEPWWWALCGSAALVLYGFVPCLQPVADFGRVYAVYGGFFIALSVLWGWALDGFKPDAGDAVGGGLAVVAVLVIMLWPRPGGGLEAGEGSFAAVA